MSCQKHKQRKRKGCSVCYPVHIEDPPSIADVKKQNKKINDRIVIKPKKEALVSKSSDIEEIPISSPEVTFESLKDQISDFIRKEVKKVVATITEELISEEARAAAKRVANEAMEKAIESYKYKAKEFSDVKHEHLAIPLGLFRVAMFDKLSQEGWKMVQTFTGEVAKVSQFKTDVVIFTRVKSDKWPKAPEFK